MQARIAGKSVVNFKNPEGQTITGVNLYILFEDSNTEGLKAEKVFVKEEIKIPVLQQNDLVEIFFNMKGKVERVEKSQNKLMCIYRDVYSLFIYH